MKIYKVDDIDMMGYTNNESYYSSLEKAENEFQKRYEELAKSPDLAEECCSSLECYQSKPIVIKQSGDEEFMQEGTIKTASFAIWERVSYEYEEYDIKLQEVRLIEIEVA